MACLDHISPVISKSEKYSRLPFLVEHILFFVEEKGERR